jgi:hypothetical protein
MLIVRSEYRGWEDSKFNLMAPPFPSYWILEDAEAEIRRNEKGPNWWYIKYFGWG